MDTYTIYSASAIASTVVLRSACAAAFPLFSPPMFAKLGDQWACSVFAFLALVCTPMPIVFWVCIADSVDQESMLMRTTLQRYGRWIRSKSTWGYKESDAPDPRSGISSRPETVIGVAVKEEDLTSKDLEKA